MTHTCHRIAINGKFLLFEESASNSSCTRHALLLFSGLTASTNSDHHNLHPSSMIKPFCLRLATVSLSMVSMFLNFTPKSRAFWFVNLVGITILFSLSTHLRAQPTVQISTIPLLQVWKTLIEWNRKSIQIIKHYKNTFNHGHFCKYWTSTHTNTQIQFYKWMGIRMKDMHDAHLPFFVGFQFHTWCVSDSSICACVHRYLDSTPV